MTATADIKPLLRITAHRLGQLQERTDSKSTNTRREVATLLEQGNIGLARLKARSLVLEDAFGDLLEALEMHVMLVLEHFNEIIKGTPSAGVVEAAASIIYAAPHADSNGELLVLETKEDKCLFLPRAVERDGIANAYADLYAVREFLMDRLPELSATVFQSRNKYVSSRVIRAITDSPPSPSALNAFLLKIAKGYDVQWAPDPQRQDIIARLCANIDPSSVRHVDIPLLRKLCARGILDEPAWLRPRIWKLLFGILPPTISNWQSQAKQQRDSYYELVRRLLEPLSQQPPPTTPLNNSDELLLSVFTQFSRIPPSLFSFLEERPEPSSDTASINDIMENYAGNLDLRLHQIQELTAPGSTKPRDVPEIRLEVDDTTASNNDTPATAVVYGSSGAYEKHSSSIFRLLYLHSHINPGQHSPHIPALIVPVYSVLMQETEPEDLAHVEADTFWLFEAILAEFSELDDSGRGGIWMTHLASRVAWADSELSECLRNKGLDPALPHYSYRWLTPLLTQTLPLSAILPIWDALFACPMMEREHNPKLDHLVNICTAMLLRAKGSIFRIGKQQRSSIGQWVTENYRIPTTPAIHPAEADDSFLEGMSLLQRYPIESAGGVDVILQMASDLAQQREMELQAPPVVDNTYDRLKDNAGTIGTRLAARFYTPAVSSQGIWEYADKLKDSDTAAAFAKVSTNWRVKALGSWGAFTTSSASTSEPTPDEPPNRQETIFDARQYTTMPEKTRTVSLDEDVYTPPPRPKSFRPPRDSMIINTTLLTSPTSNYFQASPESASPVSGDSLITRTKNMLIGPTPSTTKAGPRPFLLNSKTLITSVPAANLVTRSASSTPIRAEYWEQDEKPRVYHSRESSLARDDTVRSRPPLDRDDTVTDHVRSRSSLTRGDTVRGHTRSRSDWESDSALSSSRKVKLNRNSISPMYARPTSVSSSGTSSDRDPVVYKFPPEEYPLLNDAAEVAEPEPEDAHVQEVQYVAPRWGRVELTDSPVPPSPMVEKEKVAETPLNVAIPISRGVELRDAPVPLSPLTLTEPLSRPSSLENSGRIRKVTRSRLTDSPVPPLPTVEKEKIAEPPLNVIIPISRGVELRDAPVPLSPLTLTEPLPRPSSLEIPARIRKVSRSRRTLGSSVDGFNPSSPVSDSNSTKSSRIRSKRYATTNLAYADSSLSEIQSPVETRTQKISTRTKRVRDSRTADGDDEFEEGE